MTEITLNTSRTIAETFDDFLHAKRAKGLRSKTLQSYAYNFKAMSRHLNVEQDIVDLCKSDLDKMIASIKEEMLANDTEEMEVGTYIIRWTSVLSNRFDSTSFKKVHGDLCKAFTKQVTSRRFSIA